MAWADWPRREVTSKPRPHTISPLPSRSPRSATNTAPRSPGNTWSKSRRFARNDRRLVIHADVDVAHLLDRTIGLLDRRVDGQLSIEHRSSSQAAVEAQRAVVE